MPSRRWFRRVVSWAGAAALVAFIVSVSVVAPRAAFACSCQSMSTDADTVAISDIAFVGEVVSAFPLHPAVRDASMSLEPGGTWDIRYRVRVDESVKGVGTGQIVVVYGSTAPGQCGDHTLPQGQAVPVALRENTSGGWRRFHADVVGSCGQPASLLGFRALASATGDASWFVSPNIERAGSPEADDGRLNPAAGPVSFVIPVPKPSRIGQAWWPAITVVVVVAIAGAFGLWRTRRDRQVCGP